MTVANASTNQSSSKNPGLALFPSEVKSNNHRDANTARFWWHGELKNLSAMDTEIMQLRRLVDVPETDREVYGSRHKM